MIMIGRMKTSRSAVLLSALLCVAFQPLQSAEAFATQLMPRVRVSPAWKTTELRSSEGSEGDDNLSYGERSRRFRRTSFTHEDWILHRRSERLLQNLLSTFQSGVVRQLFTELSLVASISLVTCLWNALLVTGFQDFAGVLHSPLVRNFPLASLPLEPFSLSSPALGLLLVFRTNTSYGRWSEARKAWGAIVNHSRNIVRLGAGWVTEDDDLARKHLERLANAVWAFPRCLQRHLLGRREDEEAFCRDMQEHLPLEMAQTLMEARHKPTRALYYLTNAINALPMSYLRRLELDKSVVALCDAMGGCERIFSSPVPLVYTRHTARFLGFWLTALPMALWKTFDHTWNHIGLLPASLLISFFLFGIEELATQLEEPFSILPLEKMVGGIRLSADEAVEWHFDEESTEVRQLVKPDLAIEHFEQLLKSVEA
jgi:putative membrane protein